MSSLLIASAFVFLALLTVATTAVPAATSALPEFVGDGVTMNTAAFNQTIDRLSKGGGGILSLPAGRYLTGTIYLKSGVTLRLDNGVVIVGSTNLSDYPANPPPSPSQTLEYGRYSLIYADGQHDIGLTGEGRIAGQGSHPNFTKKDLLAHGWSPEDAYRKRPFGLCFVGCRRVQVRHVTLQDTGFWTQDYLSCDDVVIDGVTVDNRKDDANNDGIDIDGSRNVRISNCRINAGDDGICLKSSEAPCENIAISNCVISTLCNGVKFGTASRGGFRNIGVANCTISETGAAGLALEIVDGGTLDGVVVSNLVMNDVGTPIFIRLGTRQKKWFEGQGTIGPGRLRNVVISGITATLTARGGTQACSISGLPGHPVENLTIRDVKIALKPGSGRVTVDAFQQRYLDDAHDLVARRLGGEIKRLTVQEVPECAADYPEYSMFGPLPAYGFFCRHVKNLTLNDIELGFETPDLRSAIAVYDGRGFTLAGLRARSTRNSNPVVLLRDVQDALLSGCVAGDGTPVFLGVDGDSDQILLVASNLSHAASALALAPELRDRRIKLVP